MGVFYERELVHFVHQVFVDKEEEVVFVEQGLRGEHDLGELGEGGYRF
jgi:hypothetical protein